MNQTPVKLGPLALLLTVISICLTVLSILTFTTAQADQRLAEKYAENVKLRYQLEAEGQTWLSGFLKGEEEAEVENGVYQHDIEKDGTRLSIQLEEKDGIFRIIGWKLTHLWEEDTDIGNLWISE